jgi:hypothetical protein
VLAEKCTFPSDTNDETPHQEDTDPKTKGTGKRRPARNKGRENVIVIDPSDSCDERDMETVESVKEKNLKLSRSSATEVSPTFDGFPMSNMDASYSSRDVASPANIPQGALYNNDPYAADKFSVVPSLTSCWFRPYPLHCSPNRLYHHHHHHQQQQQQYRPWDQQIYGTDCGNSYQMSKRRTWSNGSDVGHANDLSNFRKYRSRYDGETRRILPRFIETFSETYPNYCDYDYTVAYRNSYNSDSYGVLPSSNNNATTSQPSTNNRS